MSATETAVETLLDRLASVIVPLDLELTLAQQTVCTGMSSDSLLRRWKFDADWFDVIYQVGKSGSDYRTTLRRIITCQERAAKRARQAFEAKKSGVPRTPNK